MASIDISLYPLYPGPPDDRFQHKFLGHRSIIETIYVQSSTIVGGVGHSTEWNTRRDCSIGMRKKLRQCFVRFFFGYVMVEGFAWGFEKESGRGFNLLC